MWGNGTLFIAGQIVKRYSQVGRELGGFQKELHIFLPYIPQSCLVFTKMSWKLTSMKRPVYRHLEKVSVTAQSWKQRRHSSGDEWINKLWYRQETITQSKKKWAIRPRKAMGEHLDALLLRKRYQCSKATYGVSPLERQSCEWLPGLAGRKGRTHGTQRCLEHRNYSI